MQAIILRILLISTYDTMYEVQVIVHFHIYFMMHLFERD